MLPRLFNIVDIFTKILSQTVFKQYIVDIRVFRLYKGRTKKSKETGINSDLIKAFIEYYKGRRFLRGF